MSAGVRRGLVKFFQHVVGASAHSSHPLMPHLGLIV